MRRFWQRLWKKSKPAGVALIVLFLLYATALLANFLSPYPYERQFREYSLCPPTRIHFIDSQGRFHLRPFVYGITVVNPAFKRYREDHTRLYPIKFFAEGRRRILGVEPPGKIFLLGTDLHGRDIFSRILHGARISLSIGLIGVSISFLLGLIIGGVSGYFGGRLDTVLMRLVEIIMTFPSFYLLLALRASFKPNISSLQLYLLIVIIMSLIGWASLARIIRGMVLSLKEEEFVMASRSLGLSTFRIITRHILPNTFSYTVTALTLSIPGYILGESTLSLLGLGIQEPYPSWGNMLSICVGNLRILTLAPWMLTPGLCIFVTVMCFNFLGDGLREVMDPRNW